MSEIKLNIYDRETKELVKTYTTDSVQLMFGTVEDILAVVDIDKLDDGLSATLCLLVALCVDVEGDRSYFLCHNYSLINSHKITF